MTHHINQWLTNLCKRFHDAACQNSVREGLRDMYVLYQDVLYQDGYQSIRMRVRFSIIGDRGQPRVTEARLASHHQYAGCPEPVHCARQRGD